MIPLLLRIRIRGKNRKGFNLWLPLFLIWLIVLPLLLLLAPLIFLAALLLWPTGKGKFILYSYLLIFRLISCMSGLKVDIQSKDSIVYVNLK